MSIAQEYLSAIVRRAQEEMEPAGYVVNWADKPRHTKFFPGTDGFALPVPPVGPDPFDAALSPPRDANGTFTVPVLGDLLLNSYARLGRRLRINANNDLSLLPWYPSAKWSRGTASGGGIYPVSVYWVTGGHGPVLPGVYHYHPFQHTMKRLLTGDATAEIAAAVGESRTVGQYLVLGLKFWQNSFKYNSFSYHATGFDVGTILQTWRMLSAAHGVTISPRLWFDEPRIGRLLNIQPEQEGIFAVVPLGSAREDRARHDGSAGTAARPPQVRYRDAELSRTVLTFETVTRLHEATVVDCAERPDPGAAKAAEISIRPGLDAVALPAPASSAIGVRQALRSRMSSFGRFAAGRAVGAARIASILTAGAAAARFDCDVLPAAEEVTLVKQYVFVNHVDGVEPGVYEYDPARNALCRIRSGGRGRFLQEHYTLGNYNLEQAAAVIVPAVRVPALLDALGDRSYRLATAVTGAVAQACYTASAAAGIGCGVALGLDTTAYLDELNLRESDEVPLLLMMIGHERARAASYRYELV